MKRKEKIMILVLIVVTVVAVISGIRLVNVIKDKNREKQNNSLKGENVEILADGTKINISSKLHETKNFDEMEISDFQLTSKNNVTQLLGIVTNKTQTTKGGYPVNIKIVDKDGKTIIIVAAYIGELRPGESMQLSTSATFDYSNAYDFSITRR